MPSCGYSLRGLQGTERITCPECGFEDSLQAIMLANRTPGEIPVWRWLLLQLAPGLVFLCLSGLVAMLSAAPDVWEPFISVMLILSIAWCGTLCWRSFVTQWTLARVFMTVVGTAAYLFANVLVWGFVLLVVVGMLRAF